MDKSEINFKPRNWAEAKKSIEALTDEYMSGQGMCETVLGEIMRAINQIIYRYYNDGDYASEGYGRETVAPAALYLFDLVTSPYDLLPDGDEEFRECMDAVADSIRDIFRGINTYEKDIKGLAFTILDLIGHDFNYFANTDNTTDMYDYQIVDSWSGRLVNKGVGAIALKRLEKLYDVYLYDDDEEDEDEEDW